GAGTNTLEAARNAGQMLTDSAGHAASQAGPLPPESLFSWGGYFQAIGFMALLMIVLWGALWAVRRYGKFRFLPIPGALPRDALRMEAQLPLGPKKGLMVVRFLDRRLLLGVTEQHITLLKEIGLHDDREREHAEFERLLQDGTNTTDTVAPDNTTPQA
ncbi:MAG: flagellar biosynthetic protein FliO, partial [Bilophila sp.]